MKKRLSVLLVTLLIISQMSISVSADNTYNSNQGIVTIDTPWDSLQGAIEELGITATDVLELYITAEDSMNSADIAYLNSMSNLKVLDVANTVTVGNVGDEFLSGLKQLTDITFPATEFGTYAFLNCYLLKNVILPKAISFGNNAFQSCHLLESVSLPEATTFGYEAFSNCYLLKHVSLPSATTFGHYAFESCYLLESVDLPEAITFDDYAFYSCHQLESVDLPEATSFGDYAFYSCHQLESVNLPKTITFGKEALSYCYSLVNLEVPKATTLGDNAFNYCYQLENINLPKVTSFGDGTFSFCYKHITMTLGSTIPTANINTFAQQSGTVIVPAGQYDNYDSDSNDTSSIDGIWFNWVIVAEGTVIENGESDTSGIVTIDSPWTGTLEDEIIALDGIDSAADVRELYITTTGTLNDTDIDYLNSMSNLEKLEVAETITIIDVGDNFLNDLEYITHVVFPATTFGNNAFQNCHQLENVILPKANTFGNDAFDDCYELREINLPNVISFDDDAFQDCYKLENVILPKVTTFGEDAFDDCYSLKEINLPNATIFGNDAFEDCYSLKEINLPSATNFGNEAFDDCYQLITVNLPSVIVFDYDAFEDCYSLKEINLPSVTEFGNDAFEDCYQLKNVILPKVTTLGDNMFRNCLSKITLTLGATIPTVKSDTFSSYDPISYQSVLRVPKSMLIQYDIDSQDSLGIPGDGLWFGWKLEEIIDEVEIVEPIRHYIVTIVGEGGKFDTNKKVSVKPGGSAQFNILPNEGYEIDDVKIDGISIGPVNSYEFTKVTSNHNIYATFKEIEYIKPDFIDVSEDEWYYEPVMEAHEKGWLSGTSETTFSPNNELSRGCFVTALWKMEGQPVSKINIFTDLVEGANYITAANWAAQQGITNGYGDNLFGPEDTITREQIVAMLYRYAQYKSYDITQEGTGAGIFADYEDISEYALMPMNWAVNVVLIQGSDNNIKPQEKATRAQIAAILTRFNENFME